MDAPFFHPISGTVRFWVRVGDDLVGASIGQETLHYRFEKHREERDPLVTYLLHVPEIEAAVRRRFAGGSREPVMLRDHDLQAPPA